MLLYFLMQLVRFIQISLLHLTILHDVDAVSSVLRDHGLKPFDLVLLLDLQLDFIRPLLERLKFRLDL